jgi:hypothetical protein
LHDRLEVVAGDARDPRGKPKIAPADFASAVLDALEATTGSSTSSV